MSRGAGVLGAAPARGPSAQGLAPARWPSARSNFSNCRQTSPCRDGAPVVPWYKYVWAAPEPSAGRVPASCRRRHCARLPARGLRPPRYCALRRRWGPALPVSAFPAPALPLPTSFFLPLVVWVFFNGRFHFPPAAGAPLPPPLRGRVPGAAPLPLATPLVPAPRRAPVCVCRRWGRGDSPCRGAAWRGGWRPGPCPVLAQGLPVLAAPSHVPCAVLLSPGRALACLPGVRGMCGTRPHSGCPRRACPVRLFLAGLGSWGCGTGAGSLPSPFPHDAEGVGGGLGWALWGCSGSAGASACPRLPGDPSHGGGRRQRGALCPCLSPGGRGPERWRGAGAQGPINIRAGSPAAVSCRTARGCAVGAAAAPGLGFPHLFKGRWCRQRWGWWVGTASCRAARQPLCRASSPLLHQGCCSGDQLPPAWGSCPCPGPGTSTAEVVVPPQRALAPCAGPSAPPVPRLPAPCLHPSPCSGSRGSVPQPSRGRGSALASLCASPQALAWVAACPHGLAVPKLPCRRTGSVGRDRRGMGVGGMAPGCWWGWESRPLGGAGVGARHPVPTAGTGAALCRWPRAGSRGICCSPSPS